MAGAASGRSTDRSRSATTEHATAFVADHLAAAVALGVSLGDLVDDPDAFVAAARAGFAELADPPYRNAQAFVAPGVGPVLGVRNPLREATGRGLRRSTRGMHASRVIGVADRLLRDGFAELRWFGLDLLARIIPEDPERGWQLVRRVSRTAEDWITIDTLGRVVARGVLAEPYRWAELEQLVYAPSRWERRLVGSAVAQMPFADRSVGRNRDVARRGLGLVAALVGDREPDVQKALSWALRSLVAVDRDAVTAFCRDETRLAVATSDGNRAWVIRDTLPKLPAGDAAEMRACLAGIRRVPGGVSTSSAHDVAARFRDLPPATSLAEPPLESPDLRSIAT